MIYRMKRNSVGLASTAILSTMVLITVCSTMALMAGVEDRLPKSDAIININFDNDGKQTDKVQAEIAKKVKTKKLDRDAFAQLLCSRDGKQKTLFPLKNRITRTVRPTFTKQRSVWSGGVKSDDRFDVRINPWYMVNT